MQQTNKCANMCVERCESVYIYQNTSSHIHTHTRTRGSRQTVTVCGGNQEKVMFVFASDFTVQYSTQWSRSAPASLRIRTPRNLYCHGARCGSSLECNLFMLCLKTLKVLEAIYRISLYKKDVIKFYIIVSKCLKTIFLFIYLITENILVFAAFSNSARRPNINGVSFCLISLLELGMTGPSRSYIPS